MFQPDPRVMQALMSRPQLMQIMMKLMQKGANVNPVELQKASEKGDKAGLAKLFKMKEHEFNDMQVKLSAELTALSKEVPQMQQMAEQMAQQMGMQLPKEQ